MAQAEDELESMEFSWWNKQKQKVTKEGSGATLPVAEEVREEATGKAQEGKEQPCESATDHAAASSQHNDNDNRKTNENDNNSKLPAEKGHAVEIGESKASALRRVQTALASLDATAAG